MWVDYLNKKFLFNNLKFESIRTNFKVQNLAATNFSVTELDWD